MLANEDAAIDANDFAFGEGVAQHLGSTLVVVRLVVGRIEHGSINDEEVGIGSRQTLVSFADHSIGEVRFKDGSGERESQQSEWFAFDGAKSFELLFHLLQGFVMDIVGVVALHIDDGVIGTESGQGIDVGVGVVTQQEAIVEPQDTLGTEVVEEPTLERRLALEDIAIGREQAFGSGEDGPLAIAFNRTTLEDLVAIVLIGSIPDVEDIILGESVIVVNGAIDLIVEVLLNLHKQLKAEGGQLAIKNLQQTVKSVFDLTGFTMMMNII